MKTRKTLETNDISNPGYEGDQISCLKIVRIPMALGRSGQVISLIAIRILHGSFQSCQGGKGLYIHVLYIHAQVYQCILH